MQRRSFLKSMALSGAAVTALGHDAWAASAAAGTNPEARKLIVVMLRGAVDGLNVVAPYTDPNYARLRPTIALARPGAENGAIDLDGRFGLHPALAPLLPLWHKRQLAFVHASGSPDQTRSHFDAQDYLESGTPGRKATQDGWLNRLVATLPGAQTPTRAVSIGAVLPRILAGRINSTMIATGPAGTRADPLDRPNVGAAFDKLYTDNPQFARAYQDGRSAHREVMGAVDTREMQAADGGAPLPNGFPADATRLARLMRRDPNIQVAFFGLGGWDTHANQGAGTGQLANRLAPLGQGLAQLATELGPMIDDTAIVVMSEFGRTAAENGNGGTDHGHGNVMWLMGGALAGGKVYGEWHGMEPGQLHEGRDLPVNTDFRQVLSQVLQHHLQRDEKSLAAIFPDRPRDPLGWRLYRDT
jgi:uncharacterized protein (DUF1501 family)